jgi:hypothetical protein
MYWWTVPLAFIGAYAGFYCLDRWHQRRAWRDASRKAEWILGMRPPAPPPPNRIIKGG